MADSTCIMQHPFSYTSGFPNESMEVGQSVTQLILCILFEFDSISIVSSLFFSVSYRVIVRFMVLFNRSPSGGSCRSH